MVYYSLSKKKLLLRCVKTSVILALILEPSVLTAFRLTFYDLQNAFVQKYSKTIVADSTFKENFNIYTKDLETIKNITVLQRIAEKNGYELQIDGDVIYIFDKKGTEKDLEKEKAKLQIDDQKFHHKLKQEKIKAEFEYQQKVKDLQTQKDLLSYQQELEIQRQITQINTQKDLLSYQQQLEKQKELTNIELENLKKENQHKQEIREERYKRAFKRLFQKKHKFFRSHLTKQKTLDLCKQLGVQCISIANNKYLVKYNQNYEVKNINKIMIQHPKKAKLLIHIYEVNLEKANHNSIDIQSAINTYITKGYIQANILGYISNKHITTQSNHITLNTFIEFLKSNGIAKTINTPSMTILDKKEATFTTGQTLQVVSSKSYDKQTKQEQIDYKNVNIGLSLKVYPEFINNGAYINFNLEISSLLSYDKTKNLVQLSKRSLNNTYMLEYAKKEVVLSYKNTFIKREVYKNFDIPIIGWLFNHNNNDIAKSSILITLQLQKV